jgi:hypothetical protein
VGYPLAGRGFLDGRVQSGPADTPVTP